MKIIHPSILAAVAAFAYPGHANALVVIDNLTASGSGFAASVSGPVGAGIFAPPRGAEAAFSFVTGTADTYFSQLEVMGAFTNLTVGLQATLSTGSAVPGGTNSTVIDTFTPAIGSPTNQTFTFAPTSTILLNASTQYWVHFTVPSGSGSYSVFSTGNPVEEPGWTLENMFYYTLLGNSWSEINTGPQPRIRLSVDPIPESGSALLGCLGSLILLRRRR